MKQIRRGGDVKRWHTVATIQDQTVGHHSWGVATLCDALWPDCSRDLLVCALHHDIPEYIVGDTPATAKWEFPEVSSAINGAEKKVATSMSILHSSMLTEQDAKRLRIADMLELMWFCVEEVAMGNSRFREVFYRGKSYIDDLVGNDTNVYHMVKDLTLTIEGR